MVDFERFVQHFYGRVVSGCRDMPRDCSLLQPCAHGRCQNTMTNFRCDCTSTAYRGVHCSQGIIILLPFQCINALCQKLPLWGDSTGYDKVTQNVDDMLNCLLPIYAGEFCTLYLYSWKLNRAKLLRLCAICYKHFYMINADPYPFRKWW